MPGNPKIYHITHLRNLASIVERDALLADRLIVQRGGPAASVGMSKIKARRLAALEVKCHPGDKVGDYVPFYFCPRSIMLYTLHRQNHPELTYRGGQEPMVHLEADLSSVIAWAERSGRRWAFSTSNAAAYYARFFSDASALDRIDWDAVQNTDFRSPAVKEAKQAELLLHEAFPWELIDGIGVYSAGVRAQVYAAIAGAATKPSVAVEKSWYY